MLINYDVWVGMGCIIYQLFCWQATCHFIIPDDHNSVHYFSFYFCFYIKATNGREQNILLNSGSSHKN